MENLLAVALLATALLSILAIFIGGLQLIGRTEKVTAATGAAREVIERSKKLGIGVFPATLTTWDGRQASPAAPVAGFPPAPYPRLTFGGVDMPVVVLARRTGEKGEIEVQVYYTPQNCVRLVTYIVL